MGKNPLRFVPAETDHMIGIFSFSFLEKKLKNYRKLRRSQYVYNVKILEVTLRITIVEYNLRQIFDW